MAGAVELMDSEQTVDNAFAADEVENRKWSQ
jgi:hypothetical protein